MSKKIIFIAAGGALLILVIGMGAGFYLLWGKVTSMSQALEDAKKEGAEGEENAEDPATQIGPKFPLDTMIVNLADTGGNRYVRLTMELELSAMELDTELKARSSQIKDAMLMTISTRTLADINSAEGKNSLRNDIIAKVNGLVQTGTVSNIYFTEFVIQ